MHAAGHQQRRGQCDEFPNHCWFDKQLFDRPCAPVISRRALPLKNGIKSNSGSHGRYRDSIATVGSWPSTPDAADRRAMLPRIPSARNAENASSKGYS
jgi:hypothetical protein